MTPSEPLEPYRPPLSRPAILDGIAEIAREKVGWGGPVSPELRLVEDLALDSIRLLTLAMEVEDRFRVCLDEDDEAEIRTIGDLADTVARKLAAEDGRGKESGDSL